MGILLGLLGNFLFSISNPLIKYIFLHRRGISEYELIYWKSIAMIFMNYLLLKSYGAFPTDVPP
jgi:hypothetical protein